jgi:outer membrane receptor protein involved in Fe transport
MHSRRRSQFIRALGLTTILAGLAPGAALAADAAAEAAAVDAPSEGLGEIIVTATRTSESIQKVPISIQALTGDTLAQRQVKGLSDFAALLPSVSFAGLGPGRNEIFFRGIVPAGGAYPSVGFYLDDIPIAGTEVPDVHVYDLARIEALSGPQGTLFGAGSLAGTVRLITNKPKIGAFEAGYDLEGNKYGPGGWGGQAQAFINIPLGETVAIRAMGYYRHDGGYVDNTPNNGKFNDGSPAVLSLGDNNPLTSFALDNSAIAKKNYNSIDEVGGRLSLLWEPADGWEITPTVTAQRQIARGYFGFDPRLSDLEVHDYDTTRNDDKWYQASLSIHGHIGDWDIVSATGYFQRQRKLLNDYSYYTVTYDGFGGGYESYLQFFDKSGCSGSGATLKCTKLLNPTQFYQGDTRNKTFTQELRLTTPKTWPFDVTVGGFFQSQKIEINDDYAIHGLADSVGYTAACSYSTDAGCEGNTTNLDGFGIPTSQGGTMELGSPAVKRDAFYLTEQDVRYKDYAVFAEGHYNITPTLKITGGIRYFWTESQRVGFAGVAGSAASSAALDVPTGGAGCTVPFPVERLQCLNTNRTAADQVGRYSEKGETHKVALNWQFEPSKMLYFNYSTGFRPGGYNRPLRIGRPGVIVAAPGYQSETLSNFEIGVKTTWNNIFRFNAAIYYEKWDNIQYGVVISGAQGAGFTGNAGKAEVKGIEFDADLKLDKFTISTSGAFNDGKLKGDFCNFDANLTTLTITQLPTCAIGTPIPNSSPPIPSVAAVDGTRLPRQPKFKGTTTVRYDTEMGKYNAYIQGAALYQTNATQNLNVDDNALLGNTPGFVSFDFSAGIKKDNWTFDVFLNNAFDKRGELTRNTFCSIQLCANSSRTFVIRPQFFGVRFGQRF